MQVFSDFYLHFFFGTIEPKAGEDLLEIDSTFSYDLICVFAVQPDSQATIPVSLRPCLLGPELVFEVYG